MPSSPRLCVSLMPESIAQLQEWLVRYREADLVELRLDRLQEKSFPEAFTRSSTPWEGLFPRYVFARKGNLQQQPFPKIIVTIRSVSEGGFWRGNPELLWELFQQALQAGADYVDVEWQQVGELLSRPGGLPPAQVVLSHHTRERDFTRLKERFQEMLQQPAAVYKLVFQAQELNDAATALRLLETFRASGKKIIIHAMGEAGIPSRLIGAVRGNAWTYVAPEEKAATAPGQITLRQAQHAYFLQEKNHNMRIVGLVGFPIAQSKGWLLHNRLLHRKQQEAQREQFSLHQFLYLNFPARDFASFWTAWEPYLSGLSVTIPHKEQVLPYLKIASPTVEKSGVCNTLIRRRGEWWGFNTDFLALLELLTPYRSSLRQGVLVVGTGATARSALAALQELGIRKLFIAGRNESRGEMLAQKFSARFYPLQDLPQLKIDGLIHTTPLGMWPNTETVPPVLHLLQKNMVVLDVVYNPPETLLLRRAREAGCRTISGREMFLRQAAHQFRMFSGRDVSYQEVASVYREIEQEAEE